ncbi:MAG: ATP-dependent sacrificial sulfur transferase LarE [Saccharofermentans sp.]|nr:ATP-dependent sacrificial sulfur transferase LarE [Saccharofermentans sp.]
MRPAGLIKFNKEYNALISLLKSLGKVAVAFSGGTDSAYLLIEATKILGPDNVIAITIDSQACPGDELARSVFFCEKHGIRQVLLKTDIFAVEGFAENTKDRCYYCKKSLFEQIKRCARDNGFDTVCDGTNKDDTGDYRPGMRAVSELGIVSPLKESGMGKEQIRYFSGSYGLETAELPSMACLATRIPYGDKITPEALDMVRKAEKALADLGFNAFRVRKHGNLARIELREEDMAKVATVRQEINRKLKEAGFTYVTLDLTGYRTGSLNEVLGKE